MKKLVNVVMLPTEKAHNCILRKANSCLEYHEMQYFTQSYLKENDTSSFNIYLTSDDEIKHGNWYIDDTNAIRQSIITDKAYWNARTDYRKIVATNDASLKIAKLPSSFMKAFARAQGNIKVVIIEYIQAGYTETGHFEMGLLDKSNTPYPKEIPSSWLEFIVKTREDSTVIVHQAKTYTREEVESLIKLAWASCSATIYKEGDDIGADCKSWIDTHLT